MKYKNINRLENPYGEQLPLHKKLYHQRIFYLKLTDSKKVSMHYKHFLSNPYNLIAKLKGSIIVKAAKTGNKNTNLINEKINKAEKRIIKELYDLDNKILILNFLSVGYDEASAEIIAKDILTKNKSLTTRSLDPRDYDIEEDLTTKVHTDEERLNVIRQDKEEQEQKQNNKDDLKL